MKKLIVLVLVFGAVAAALAKSYPAKFERYSILSMTKAEIAWNKIESNPIPIVVALGTFVMTFIYHKAKGKSFRESVEVAATRVTVVQPVPAPNSVQREEENPVLKRARDRTTRIQLLADQVEIRNRIAKLPEALIKAEQEYCFKEKAVLDAKAALGEKYKARNQAENRLANLRSELETGRAEIEAIEAELMKLKQVA